MRHVLSLILAGCVLAIPVRGQEPSERAVPTKNDVLAGALWRLAAATKTRIGFEATDHVKIAPYRMDIPPLSFLTLEDGLNAAVGADGRYEWRKIGDFVVVRPIEAWDDLSNPFNRPMRGVQVAHETPSSVLLRIRDFIYTNRFAVVDPVVRGTAVSFELRAGTVIDVLNELTTAADYVLWIASYRPLGQSSDRWPEWDLALELRDSRRTQGFSGSHPPKSK